MLGILFLILRCALLPLLRIAVITTASGGICFPRPLQGLFYFGKNDRDTEWKVETEKWEDGKINRRVGLDVWKHVRRNIWIDGWTDRVGWRIDTGKNGGRKQIRIDPLKAWMKLVFDHRGMIQWPPIMKVVMLQSVERLPVTSLKIIKMSGVEYEILYVVRKIRLTLLTVSMQP